MTRIFAYVRVSTNGQTTENQIQEISNAGFQVEEHRIISETVSGSFPAMRRDGFVRLVDRLEKGDILVVTKMDRLGRDAMDVSSTVGRLEELGIKVHCLALGGVDLTSSSGKLTMGVINAVAQFEKDLLVERTQAGLARARSQGKKLGRPRIMNEAREHEALEELAKGTSISKVARRFNVSRQTIMRLKR